MREDTNKKPILLRPQSNNAALILSITLSLSYIAHGAPDAQQPSPVVQDEKPQNTLPEIDHRNAPLVGSPDAPYIVTLLFDYQCPRCQPMHFMLDEVIRQYDGKVAFAMCPAPLEQSINPYLPKNGVDFKNSGEIAKLGLAVWLADRESFHAFDIWMFSFESGSRWQSRSLDAAKAKAAELVGQDALDTALADPWVDEYLQTCIKMFGQTLENGKGLIPKMVYGSRWVIPDPSDTENLMMILQKTLNVPAP